MQLYIVSIIEANPDLPKDQKSILFINIYLVHKSEAFTTHIYLEYPHIIIIFVPGNCTCIFQPANVGLQHVIKHHLKQSLFHWMVVQQQSQVLQSIDAAKVRIMTSYPKLCDASVKGLLDVYDFMNNLNGRDIVKMVKFIIPNFQTCLWTFISGLEKMHCSGNRLQFVTRVPHKPKITVWFEPISSPRSRFAPWNQKTSWQGPRNR